MYTLPIWCISIVVPPSGVKNSYKNLLLSGKVIVSDDPLGIELRPDIKYGFFTIYGTVEVLKNPVKFRVMFVFYCICCRWTDRFTITASNT